MRQWIVAGTLVGFFLMGAAVGLAHEGEAHEHGGVQTISGEVVDLACYLSEGAMGAQHRDCAQKCIASGLPVGIKSGDQIYLAVSGEHGPANETLAPLAAKQVQAEGFVTERNGVHLIAIKKVTVVTQGSN